MADVNEGRLDVPRSRARFIAFGVIAVLLFSVLGGRLFQLQVVNGALYAARAAAVRTVEVPLPAARGLIFDRDGRPVAVNVPAWTVRVRSADLPAGHRSRVLQRVAEATGTAPATLRSRLAAYQGSPYDLVPVVRGATREAALVLSEAEETLPGVVVEVEPIRQYLDETGAVNGPLLAHVLGYTGPVSRDQYASLAEQGYLRDDVIGKAGVEASFEELLRGDYGLQLVERDAAGRMLRVIEAVEEPTPGTNLMLTLDADIQRLAEQALTWGMEVAAVSQGVTIVMNPQTGEILGMVSLPAYDNNKFAAGISGTDYSIYLADETRPLRNHAISDIYPPGSTFKLVTALSALESGITTPAQQWPTYGCYQIPGAPAGECLYDWNRTGFGSIDIVDAFAVSSDTFFYQMAVNAGIDTLAEWAGHLGFGSESGIALPGEEAGIVASTDWARQQGRTGVYTGEVAMAGIGQGVIAVTPLQLLNAYAALANGGRLMEPMVVRGEADAAGNLVRAFEPRVISQVPARAEHLELLRIAAREVITSGHAYNIRDLALPGALSGKTGPAEFGELTAKASTMSID
ncbi:MAG: penicillin-binding protein 2, partial [Candidatus Limnocylindria bacterium]